MHIYAEGVAGNESRMHLHRCLLRHLQHLKHFSPGDVHHKCKDKLQAQHAYSEVLNKDVCKQVVTVSR